MSSLKRQGKAAFIWDFGGKLARHGMSFIVSMILAHLLTPTDFGLVAMVMVIVGVAGIFTDVGLGSALIQRRFVPDLYYSSVFYFNLAVGALLTTVVFFSAPLIATFYHNEALTALSRVVAFLFLLNALSAVQTTRLRRELDYALLTKANLLSSLVSGLLGVLLASFGAGVWALVVQSLSQGLFYNLLIWVRSSWRPSAVFSIQALRRLWRFGFHIFLSGLLDRIFSTMDDLLIGKLFPASYLGHYNRSKTLRQLIVDYSSGSIMSVMFPILSKVQNDLHRFQNIVMKAFHLILFLVFLMIGWLYLIAHDLIWLLYGSQWERAADYFQIMVLSAFAYPLSALMVNVLSSRGESGEFLKLDLYKKLLMPFNLGVLYFFGIETFLYFIIVTSFIALYLNAIFVRREINLPLGDVFRPLFLQYAIIMLLLILIKGMDLIPHRNPLLETVAYTLEFIPLYFALNSRLKIKGYIYFMQEFRPVMERFKRKFGR